MGKLIYSMITSLDGYVADEAGNFDWAEPDAEFHSFINDHSHNVGTYIYGRRMYETMVYWETASLDPDVPPYISEWTRQWRAAEKIVVSGSLAEPKSERTTIERTLNPGMVEALKRESQNDISISGPHIAASAFRANLVDEIQAFIVPVIVGGGNRFYPDGIRINVDLLDERRFTNGTMYLRYRILGWTKAISDDSLHGGDYCSYSPSGSSTPAYTEGSRMPTYGRLRYLPA